MNVLVTGGAGFIGSCFVRQSVARGDKTIILDALTYAGHKENLEDLNCELVKGDIGDGELVLKLLQENDIEAVINFAAESHVDNSIKSPGQFITTNINGTYTMLEASRRYWGGLLEDKKKNFRYVQISTDEVYGDLELNSPEKFNEKTSYKPSSPYSASKAAGDQLALAWHRTYNFPAIVTNCSNNYGPRQFPEKLIPNMVYKAISGKSLPIYGNGENIRDWIHVEDHCNGVYLALTKGQVGQTYCFGGNAEKSNIDLVNKICEILDEIKPSQSGKSYKEQISFVDDRAGHDLRYAIDDRKAQSELGFTRNYNLTEGLQSTVKWYLNNEQWCKKVSNKISEAA